MEFLHEKKCTCLEHCSCSTGAADSFPSDAYATYYDGVTPVAYGPATTAQQLKVNPSGVGHMLLVPYFTSQGDNATLLTITNTDGTNGKAVKVRFRGASNSDDLFDFQVFLSPNDVWTGMVTKDADGLSRISTEDKSCMKGLSRLQQTPFSVVRVDDVPPVLTAAVANAETREGYIEIFNMADIEPTLYGTTTAGGPVQKLTTANPIYNGIVHTAGVPSCANLGGLEANQPGWAGLTAPSTGLTGEWMIINQATAAAYGGNDVAIQALTVAVPAVPALGNVVYWPQTPVLMTNWPSNWFTADPLLEGDLSLPGPIVPFVLPLQQDFPDLSTPYTLTALAAGVNGAAVQARDLTNALSVVQVGNEFLTDPDANAATDFVFTMPTRRYNVALDYGQTNATHVARFSSRIAAPAYFSTANVTRINRQLCVFGITQVAYDREEVTPSLVEPSPQKIPMICGETNVLGINQTILAGGSTNVLQASVAVAGAEIGGTTSYDYGWMNVLTPGLANPPQGLPIIGSKFTRAINGASNFGVNTDHKTRRVNGFAY